MTAVFAITGAEIFDGTRSHADHAVIVENGRIADLVPQRQVGAVRAVDGVSFSIRRGETLGLVGESGCGKSTIGKVVLKLIEPTAGRIVLAGEDVTSLKPGAMWTHRRRIQTIFQDPYSSMNPRLPSGTIVGEPLENFGIAKGADRDDRDLVSRAGEHGLFERWIELHRRSRSPRSRCARIVGGRIVGLSREPVSTRQRAEL